MIHLADSAPTNVWIGLGRTANGNTTEVRDAT